MISNVKGIVLMGETWTAPEVQNAWNRWTRCFIRPLQKSGGGIWRKEDGAGLSCPPGRPLKGGLRWRNISGGGGVGWLR
jgi:hypothetical protein